MSELSAKNLCETGWALLTMCKQLFMIAVLGSAHAREYII